MTDTKSLDVPSSLYRPQLSLSRYLITPTTLKKSSHHSKKSTKSIQSTPILPKRSTQPGKSSHSLVFCSCLDSFRLSVSLLRIVSLEAALRRGQLQEQVVVVVVVVVQSFCTCIRTHPRTHSRTCFSVSPVRAECVASKTEP
ncbi:hypothetical protein E2C01_010301 [Portunus trituberculatus]|uniref:Uncharacterized protein n=1 Tax=Portunus trituberculatus TaxID=210409 RepID=A0A5B7D889_PORTR|nr:hypothetical protein [Portunus trituberculatus]